MERGNSQLTGIYCPINSHGKSIHEVPSQDDSTFEWDYEEQESKMIIFFLLNSITYWSAFSINTGKALSL